MTKNSYWFSTTYTGSQSLKLGKYLRGTLLISTTLLRKLKANDCIQVNNKIAHTNYLLQPGDLIEILPISEEPGLPPEDIPLEIIFEDEYLLVVNKPAGMVAHPVKHYTSGTLANALAYYFSQGPISRQVRLVHRLDKDTSGLLLVSKNPLVHNDLVRALKAKEIKRIYWALVEGELQDSGIIDAPIGADAENSSRQEVKKEGRAAVTHYRALKTWPGKVSLVELQLETGRTHQIRVHLAHIGHPLLGDAIYNDPQKKVPINRQALHAKGLVFKHPVTAEVLKFDLPLPPDMARVVRIFDRYAELGL